MGYDTELRGRMKASKAVSREYLDWLDKWLRTRHSLFNIENIKKALSMGIGNIPGEELGVCGLYYANPNPTRDLLFDNNTVNPCLGDYYFPLKISEESYEANEDGMYDIMFEASGLEKPYGVDESLAIFYQKEFADHLGDVSGVILGVGEEFGDAWYVIVSNNVCARIPAYDSRSRETALSFIRDDEIAKEIFEEVYRTEQALENYW